MSYGRKRDKRIVLSSNMISWEYITVSFLYPLNFVSQAFVYTSFHAESLRRNGAKAVKWWSEGAPHAGVSGHHRASSNVQFRCSNVQTCFVESSLVMRHGFFSTTWKPSAWAVSGSLQHHRGRRKQDSQNQKSKSCWSHSSMSRWSWGASQNPSSSA